jgi:hypothetical protein
VPLRNDPIERIVARVYSGNPMKNFTRLTLVLVALSTLSAVAKDKKPPLDIEVVAIHETSAFTIHDEKVASFDLDAIVEGQHVFLECAAPEFFPCGSVAKGTYQGKYAHEREFVDITFPRPLVGGTNTSRYKIRGSW